MKDSDFQNLCEGIREAGAYLRGNKNAVLKKTKSKATGKNTSVEISHISPRGERLLIGGEPTGQQRVK
jgi:hypothetical protein